METVYERASGLLSNLSVVQSYPEEVSLLKRVTASTPRDWRLPALACEAVGGDPERAIPGVAAIAAAQISIILIDDLLDADPRGEHQRIGMPSAANLAAAFQAAALEAIADHDSDPIVKQAALRSLNHMLLMTAFGQYLDSQNPGDEAAYWRVVQTKSAPFFSAALHVGALLGGADGETADGIQQLGCLYGEMIQIHDDLNDCMAVPANPDWTQGRSPLPILFAQVVDHPDRARFVKLRRAIPDPEALAEAQTILIRCGAISYGIHHLLERYQKGQALLAAMAVPRRDLLETLLADLINPVQALFVAVGMEKIPY